MPRTKKVITHSNKSKIKDFALKFIDDEKKYHMAALDEQMEKELNILNVLKVTQKTKFPLHILNGTIREIVSGELDSTLNSTKMSKKTNQTMSSTSKKKSASFCCEDEGYTTAESSRGTTSGDGNTRLSRAKLKTATKQISRSLSRNTAKKVPFITPANKQPPKDHGTITPKCKLNAPQTIVRRPKVGEMAWSNQGSPLLTTNTITAEQIANVNIPLPDGNIVSLLPQKGVRVSQIPALENDVKRQLETLRDNLIKVCSEMKN